MPHRTGAQAHCLHGGAQIMMSNVIEITPFQVLGRLETVTDFLNAYALTRVPMDDRLLGYVERLRELHRQLDQAMQRQRLKDQLMFSLAVLEPVKPEDEEL